MIGKVYLLIPVAATAGFLGGFVARQPREELAGTGGLKPVDSTAEAGTATDSPPPGKPGVKSADTVKSLLALDDSALYPRFALWLLDAGEKDMAGFLAAYGKRTGPDEEILELLFARWTKVNPASALAAAKGSGHEDLVWWARALNDPDAAVRDVPAEFSDHVMRALGQFHPERVRPVLADHPGFRVWEAGEVAVGIARTDPAGALKFLRQNDDEDHVQVIEDWTRRDPHAALEWLREHPDRTGGSFEEAFVETLERENPGMLAELAAAAPSGKLKRELENAAFRHLAKENPADALAAARASAAPRIKAERLAEVGKGIAQKDPKAALGILKELFTALPDAANRTLWMRSGESDSREGGEMIEGLDDFLEVLVDDDPQALMNAARQADFRARDAIAEKWVRDDPEGFSTWLLKQTGEVRDRGVAVMASHLAGENGFAEAVDWAAEIANPDISLNTLSGVLRKWVAREPEAAKEWFGQAGLSERSRQHLEDYFPNE